MQLLIQHNLMNETQLQKIRDAVQHLPHQFVGMIPFSRELTSNEPIVGNDYIPYGSTLMTTVAHELYDWKGLYFNLDRFNYEQSVEHRRDMLNEWLILPVEETIEFMRKCNPTDLWFVRPSLDLKQFSGQVIEAKECADWLQDAMTCDTSGSYKIEAGTMIVIAPPKKVQAEWRWFVVGGRVVSGSMYRAHGQMRQERVTEQALIDEAQKIARRGWLPASCCVMDLALVNDELKVIEFNCINSSGFYDNDIRAVFDALYRYTLARG